MNRRRKRSRPAACPFDVKSWSRPDQQLGKTSGQDLVVNLERAWQALSSGSRSELRSVRDEMQHVEVVWLTTSFHSELHDERDERKVTAAARLLPAALRERQIREWLDHLACEREAGRDPQRALRSILLRSVLPIAVTARARGIGHALARSR
jgi:hypothetical protein